MKLNISKNESTKGLIRKKKIYEMFVNVEMTQDELAAYKSVEKEIESMIIAPYQTDGLDLSFRVADLVYTHTKPSGKGYRFEFSAQHQIPDMESEIKENVKAFSNYLKKVQAGGDMGDESIEL